MTRDTHCTFVPPWLLARVADASPDAAVADWCRATLQVDAALRARREARAGAVLARPATPADLAVGGAWTVHSADHTTGLPGRAVRRPGSAPVGDAAADEAAAGIDATLVMFAEVLERSSYDDRGAPVSVTVHYGRDYDNAFWDGTQLVFGDGDGKIFDRFTKPVDVLAHEFAHAVTEHTAALVYQGQSGALNESVSDVFAACLKQRLLGQDAADGDWLIGEGLFLPGVRARALRDMAAPGTAYDDPVLGADPQVGHLDDYVETADDNGGVHLNSGIPNRAFQLAAVGVGGSAIEGAGRIWYAALTGPDVSAATDFAGFAAATIAAAGEHADTVAAAWAQVGVVPAGTGSSGAGSSGTESPETGPAGSSLVRVSRSGGFIGRTTTGVVDLDSDEPLAGEVRSLVERIELAGVRGGLPRPDMFVYTFEVRGAEPVTVPQQHLSAELAALAALVLDQGGPLDPLGRPEA
jgi:hypothetical protein